MVQIGVGRNIGKKTALLKYLLQNWMKTKLEKSSTEYIKTSNKGNKQKRNTVLYSVLLGI